MFVRANSYSWNKADQSKYKDSIVFIEDSKQIYSNGVYYGAGSKNNIRLEKIEFSEENIILEPDKFYVSNNVLKTLDITLTGDTTRANTYFVEFVCDNTCVILPSNIKWENEIVPDFSKLVIMTIKIQDNTAYLIDCKQIEIEYQLIDLGLPSGIRWADRNIGAMNPEDAGLYFQWGDTIGYTADQVGNGKVFDWNSYFDTINSGNTFKKYNNNGGLTVLESIDDAATAHMGSKYRIPTSTEIQIPSINIITTIQTRRP